MPVASTESMSEAVARPGRYRDAFESMRASLDVVLDGAVEVPVPKDPGGGYTHERHKANYRDMYNAGLLYRLTGDERYSAYVAQVLLAYAQLYPSLPIHPEKRNGNKGKLFWQGLNEAVWLVHTIQAYEAVRGALSQAERDRIEEGVLRPMALFLSVESPETFDRIHNHATWSTAAVGMAGYVLGENEWVQRALLGLDKTGRRGFLRQLHELFSPDGYYNEGPYYQRYALLPFVTFASVIDRYEPERGIFEYRQDVILTAIRATVELSYNGLFFPLNDAIKSKGIDTEELVLGVAVAYARTGDPELLDIAQQQGKVLLTQEGFRVVQGIEDGLSRPYVFNSRLFSDGSEGTSGALAVLRHQEAGEASGPGQALVFKATSQGGGHGHFDKLGWQFYDYGAEIVSDYGAARFLNVAAKDGGRYLPENKSWAKQTIAHNALVVDEVSHFGGNPEIAEQHHPEVNFFSAREGVSLCSATMNSAYPDTSFTRTMASLPLATNQPPVVVDLLHVESAKEHQFDLPYHYQGQWMEANFATRFESTRLEPLGSENGYQHLWLQARAQAKEPLSKITWLNDNGRFYTLNALTAGGEEFLLTQLGANDPHLNLRSERAFILRVVGKSAHDFVSVLEPHGEYNPSAEYTLDSQSRIANLEHTRTASTEAVAVTQTDGARTILAICTEEHCPENETRSVRIGGESLEFSGRFRVFRIVAAEAGN